MGKGIVFVNAKFGHTNECLNIKNKKYENIGNINKEIIKYNEFKNI